MKKVSIFILFSLFLAQLQAQDSTLLANNKHELTIAPSLYLIPILGLQGSTNFHPIFLYKHKIAPNKLHRVGILGSSSINISDAPTQISVKDTIIQTFDNQKNYSIAQFHVGFEKQRLFNRNNRFRAMYGCDAIFDYSNETEQLNGKRYIKKNEVYILSEQFVADDFKLLSDKKTYGLGLSPFFSIDYRILKRVYLGGVINAAITYNITKSAIDFNMLYNPTLSFRF
jgi:hypothetical protein